MVNAHPILEWMTGRGGVRVDMAAGGDLCAALTTLLTDPDRRRGLGCAARKHCVANFSRDTVVTQVLEYYKRVLGRFTATVPV